MPILQGEIGQLNIDFDARPPNRYPHVMGVMAPPKDWQKGAKR